MLLASLHFRRTTPYLPAHLLAAHTWNRTKSRDSPAVLNHFSLMLIQTSVRAPLCHIPFPIRCRWIFLAYLYMGPTEVLSADKESKMDPATFTKGYTGIRRIRTSSSRISEVSRLAQDSAESAWLIYRSVLEWGSAWTPFGSTRASLSPPSHAVCVCVRQRRLHRRWCRRCRKRRWGPPCPRRASRFATPALVLMTT